MAGDLHVYLGVRPPTLSLLCLLGLAACGNEIMAPGLYDRRVTLEEGDTDGPGGDPGTNQTGDGDGTFVPIASTMTAVSAVSLSAFAGTAVDEPPAVVVRDQAGNVMAGQSVSFTVTQGNGVISTETVTTSLQGIAELEFWKLGKTVAPNQLRATLPSQPGIQPVQFNATVRTEFTITVQFLSSVTTTQRAAFENAAKRWSAVITGDLTNFTVRRSQIPTNCGGDPGDTTLIDVDDLIIFARIGPIDGPQGILGQASPCATHDDSGAVAVGYMNFDIDDVRFLEDNNVFEGTILHEMGHVIGVGSLWASQGLIISPSVGNPGANTRFTGPRTAAAFVGIGGTGFAGTTPAENNGVQGSADVHWREGIFKNELMSPSISGAEPSLPLSDVTIASLIDLGVYTVNEAAADDYTLATATLTALGGVEPEPLTTCTVFSPTEEHPLGGGIMELR